MIDTSSEAFKLADVAIAAGHDPTSRPAHSLSTLRDRGVTHDGHVIYQDKRPTNVDAEAPTGCDRRRSMTSTARVMHSTH
jgi:hypothetical protein